jgi:hypothetical protein
MPISVTMIIDTSLAVNMDAVYANANANANADV